MIVLSVTDCPKALRGDLSKWLCEINTGVYVGTPNARVRDALWDRVCSNVKEGKATLVYSTNNEQGYAFKVHNTDWVPIDYEGITLIQRPANNKSYRERRKALEKGFSDASRYKKARQIHQSLHASSGEEKPFSIIDLETTGLNPERDAILEIGIVKIKMGTIIASESFLIEQDNKIPENITKLTGITDQEVMDMGIPLEEALHKLAFLIKGTIVYGYNVDFDCSFLRYAYDKHKLEFPIGRTKDVLRMARKKIDRILDYKMATVASYFSLEETVKHRALPDCQLTYRILMKLNEK